MGNWDNILIGILFAGISIWLSCRLALRWLKKKLLALLGAPAPPLRIKLKPTNAVPSEDDAREERIVKDLLECGFQEAGDYEIENLGATLRCFRSPRENLFAYLCRHPALETAFLDLVCLFEDGTTLTVTDSPEQQVDQCPSHPGVRLPAASVPELLEAMRARSRDKKVRIILALEAAEVYEQGYAAVMDWRVERGGVSEEEMRRHASGEMSAEQLAEAQGIFRQQNLDQLQELLEIRYRESGGSTDGDHDYIFIHDRMTPQDLVGLVQERLDLDDSPSLQPPSGGGRSGFQELRRRLTPQDRVTLVGRVEGSIPADVYKLPGV